jgi:hypothetical protein
MDTLSVSVEVEFPPKVAEAQTGSASIASALPAISRFEISPCFLIEVMIPETKFGCSSFLP